jgi:hypothetical protein
MSLSSWASVFASGVSSFGAFFFSLGPTFSEALKEAFEERPFGVVSFQSPCSIALGLVGGWRRFCCAVGCGHEWSDFEFVEWVDWAVPIGGACGGV